MLSIAPSIVLLLLLLLVLIMKYLHGKWSSFRTTSGSNLDGTLRSIVNTSNSTINSIANNIINGIKNGLRAIYSTINHTNNSTMCSMPPVYIILLSVELSPLFMPMLYYIGLLYICLSRLSWVFVLLYCGGLIYFPSPTILCTGWLSCQHVQYVAGRRRSVRHFYTRVTCIKRC